MRSSKYTRAVLEPVVARSRSLADVIRAFGLKPTGGNYRYFTAVLFKAGLDTSHFGHGGVVRQIRDLSRDELDPLVRAAISTAQVLARLGLPTEGRPQRELDRRIADLGLDAAHFRGQGSARGETKETHAALARISRRNSLPTTRSSSKAR
jgi:hypothetical protein